MKTSVSTILVGNFMLLMYVFAAEAQSPMPTPYAIEQAVIASGGDTSSDGNASGFTITGTIGQSVAGSQSNNAQLVVKSGFWTSPPLAPTAASVTVSGRVTTAPGQGIRNVRVTLSSTTGEMSSTLTSSFGYFRFDDVTVGQVYVFSVSAKRYTFADPTQAHNIVEETDGINFVADP